MQNKRNPISFGNETSGRTDITYEWCNLYTLNLIRVARFMFLLRNLSKN